MDSWKIAESKVARKAKGKRVPGSGNGAVKGDVLNDTLCIEVKETKNLKHTIQIPWFSKTIYEAEKTKRIPVLVLEFGDLAMVYLTLVDYYKDYTSTQMIDLTGAKTWVCCSGDLSVGTTVKVGSCLWVSVEDINDIEEK